MGKPFQDVVELCHLCKKHKTSSSHKCSIPQNLLKNTQFGRQMTFVTSSNAQKIHKLGIDKRPPQRPLPGRTQNVPLPREVHFADKTKVVTPEMFHKAENGFYNWEHMKIKGKIRHKDVIVLIDSGCTHNFVSFKVVEALGINTRNSEALVVHLPNGSRQLCSQRAINVLLQIQSYFDVLDLGVMELAHIDVILGQQWLFAKDPTISFRNHTISLQHNGSHLKLYGEKGLQNLPMVASLSSSPFFQ
jgi:hypothetical protein